MSVFKVPLGVKVKDKLTGFEGTVYARHEYLYGQPRYSVQPLELKDSRPQELIYLDESQIDVVEG